MKYERGRVVVGAFIRGAAAFGLLMGLPGMLLAEQGRDSDDSTSADVSPTPAHSHRHHHAKGASTASATPSPENVTGDSEADVTPATSRKKHHHAEEDDSTGAVPAKPAASPEESDNGDQPAATPKPEASIAPNASLDSDQLEEFSRQPEKIRALIEASLDLTRQNLTYTPASADPANGGMDCSGFIYYLLTQAGLKDVPRDASGQYSWVRKADKFRAVISRNLDGFEMDELKPGDLLFWVGTYKTEHDPPVTHTMLYLGREKSTGNRVMAGSSDGRSYHGLERWGVSVFDLKAASSPSPGRAGAQFIGYGAIPGF